MTAKAPGGLLNNRPPPKLTPHDLNLTPPLLARYLIYRGSSPTSTSDSAIEVSLRDKRVVFTQRNVAALEDVKRPFDVGGMNEVLVEARSTLVSVGTELALLTAAHVYGLKYPFSPGYSLTGVVTRVGSWVSRFAEGDSVFCIAPHRSFCRVDISKDSVVKIPSNVTFDQASFARLGIIAFHGVKSAGLKAGESVSIIGQGVVGNLAMQFSKIYGSGPAIAVDRHDWKLEISRKCGADAIVNAVREDPRDTIRTLTNGRGVNVVIEATGNPAAVPVACELCREGGRVILLGSTRGRVDFDFYNVVHRRGLAIVGAHVSTIGLDSGMPQGLVIQSYLEEVLTLIQKGELKVDPLVSHRIPSEKAPELYRELSRDRGRFLGIIFDWTASPVREEGLGMPVSVTGKDLTSRELSPNRVGFAIVGCGAIARTHAEAISHSRFGRLVAVADVDEFKARRLGEKYSVPWYTKLEKLLKDEHVSVVNVCTPPGTHGEVAETAALAGKHVLVEKPIEAQIEKAYHMIAICEKAGVKLGVVLQNRFLEPIRKLKAALSEGQFGRLILASVEDRSFRTTDFYELANWRGALIHHAVHGADLLCHLLGPVASVFTFAKTSHVHEIDVEDALVAVMNFQEGCLGVLECTTAAYGNLGLRLEIHGTEGSTVVEGREILEWKFRDPRAKLYFMGKQQPMLPTIRRWAVGIIGKSLAGRLNITSQQSVWYSSHREVVDDMARAVLDKRDPLVDGREAVKSLNLMLACEESFRTGRAVQLMS